MIAPLDPRPTWIQTASGRVVDLTDPRPEDLDPGDIAHALSHLCRFGGHAREYVSVAQHCLVVSRLVPPGLALEGLLHDAAEAYLGDVVSPLKAELYRYRLLEARFSRAIEARFGIAPRALEIDEVRAADRRALAMERETFMAPPRRPWPELHGVEAPGVTLVALPPAAAREGFSTRLAGLLAERARVGEGAPA